MATGKDKPESDPAGGGRADAVRNAVDQAFQATALQAASAANVTAGARERVQDIADDLAQAAGKVREAIDDLRPPTIEEVRQLQRDLGALEERVSALEKGSRGGTGKGSRGPRS